MSLRRIQEEIRSTYPSLLTLDNVRTILRISKRKASWMLKNGYIKCTDSGKKTHQYKVRIEDLLAYMKKVEQGKPEVKIPTGLFNAHPTKRNRSDILIVPGSLHEQPPDDFKVWLEKEWSDIAECLTVKEVALLTGYQKQTVQKWIASKKLKSVWAQNKLLIAKRWVIKFYCSYGYKIQNKCEKHIKLLLRYYAL